MNNNQTQQTKHPTTAGYKPAEQFTHQPPQSEMPYLRLSTLTTGPAQ